MGPCNSLPKPLDRAICSQARAICAAGIATPVSAIMTSEEGSRDAFDAIRSKLKSQGTLPVHCLNSSSASSCWTRVDNQMNKQLRAQTVSHNISQDKKVSEVGLTGIAIFDSRSFEEACESWRISSECMYTRGDQPPHIDQARSMCYMHSAAPFPDTARMRYIQRWYTY